MPLDGRLRFDNYVVGSANRLAVAASRAVADAPGAAYNPLFIYSSSGLGKSHLLAAIGHQARQMQEALAVELLSLEEFVEQLHASISTGEIETFKRRYQHIDMLLLDDVQFLTGRRETQAEMLRLFNVLQGGGRQIVMASDRAPDEIADVDERLVSRLAGGLIADIGAPDFETRVAILRRKCAERGIEFRSDVLEELGQIDFTNVRELQGALNRLIAEQSVKGELLGLDAVRALAAERGGRPQRPSRATKGDELKAAAAAAEPPAPPRPPAADRSRRTPPPMKRVSGGIGEFHSFLSDIAQAVAQHVEPWKIKLGEAIAYWRGEGYMTSVLERALDLPQAPDIDGLLATYVAAIEHLKALEAEATLAEEALGGSDVFRDPERVAEAEDLVDQAILGRTPPPGPAPNFTRSSFEVGASNQLAVRAMDTVVSEPGRRFNPVLLHGPSGVGKTHLLNAIGNELANNGLRVACISAQAFIDELIASLQDGSVERWRARYRFADVLLLDDVQFVAGKERTQEELFHVFNLLYDAGKQIVLTSDSAPNEIADLEDRLRSRFEGGLVAGIQPPDRSLRERLYARFLALKEPTPDPALVSFLAERPAASVRELQGTVHRLMAAAELAGAPLTVAVARAELGEGVSQTPAFAAAAPQVGDVTFLDSEKVVWDWPDIGGRVIEEIG